LAALRIIAAMPMTTVDRAHATPPPYPLGTSRYWDLLAGALLAALLLFVVATFKQHGVSNDEPVQHTYGRLLLDFYSSGLTDLRAFDYLNLHLYGGLFDIIAAALEPWVTLSVWDLRHLLSALFGLVGIVFVGLTARHIAGPRAGCLAAMLLGLTGAWSGAMFTHTKDVPFAAAMIAATYFTTRLLSRLHVPQRSDIIGTGLALGAALGLRVGGLFAVIYLLIGLAAVLVPTQRSWADWQRTLRQLWASLAVIALITMVVMALAWPWSVMGWHNLFDAATKFSHFSFDMKTQLAGQMYEIGDVPRTYLVWYLLIRLPELLLAGLLLAGVLAARGLWQRQFTVTQVNTLLPVLLAGLFPLAYTLATSPALYNGIRHFTFVVPPLAVLAALGLDGLLSRIRTRRISMLLVTTALLGTGLDNLLLLVRLHPYQYVAYNQLIGGTAGAYERYELDYWSDAARESALLLNHLLRDELGNAPAGLTVAFCGESAQVNEFLDPRFRVVRDWPSADFYIAATQTGCDRVMSGTLIGDVSREGIPLMVIKDRRELVGPDRRVLPLVP
jgi:hypothetical protein